MSGSLARCSVAISVSIETARADFRPAGRVFDACKAPAMPTLDAYLISDGTCAEAMRCYEVIVPMQKAVRAQAFGTPWMVNGARGM